MKNKNDPAQFIGSPKSIASHFTEQMNQSFGPNKKQQPSSKEIQDALASLPNIREFKNMVSAQKVEYTNT